MNIVTQILFSEDWKPIMDIVYPNLAEYSEKHNYRYTAISIHNYNNWYKIRTMYDMFNNHPELDFIFNRDADTLITNMNVKLESFIEEGKDFYITKDFNGINSGAFLIRKSEWSKRFILYVESMEGKEGIYGEQDAIVKYMNEFPNDEKIKILPQSSFNSYLYENYPEIPTQTEEQGQWVKGKSFLLHLPGLGMSKRLEILNEVKQHIIYE